LAKLVETAELKTTLNQQMVASSRFKVNWNTVKQWRIDTRYDPSVAQSQAQELFASVTENIDRVLTWLRTVLVEPLSIDLPALISLSLERHAVKPAVSF
jgi:hypothetical protein